MSNEVNQAYLRAYIKNRVASSREREASSPLPTRQIPTSQGGLENMYRRADAAREQISGPKNALPATVNPVAEAPMTATPVTATPVPQRASIARPAMVQPASAEGARSVAVRNVLGSQPVPAHSAAPATPSFATMPAMATKPSVATPFAAFPSVTPLDGQSVNDQPVRPYPPGTPHVEPAARRQAVRHNATRTVAPPHLPAGHPVAESISTHPDAETVPGAATAPAEESRDEAPGVWSPLGVERGMKGAGVFRQQPAVVVNGTTYAGGAGRTSASQRVASGVDQSNLRIDPAHGPAKQSEPENHWALEQKQHVAEPVAHQPVRDRSPEHFARDMARREIEERLVREERRAAPAGSKVQSFVQPFVEQLADVEFRPSWEVDRFFWPEVLYQLENADRQSFELIGRHLISANQDGLKVMAITSGERGVGRSTVAMHLARAAAAAGLKVALIDTDTSCPSLIDQLRLDMDHGWQDSLFENVPLEEVAVRSTEENLTVFPLTSVIAPQQLHANLSRVAKFVHQIAEGHDIVFLDSHRLNLEQRDLVGVSKETFVDAAVVVVDTELSIQEKVDTAICILQGMGVASIGLVENFHA